MTTEGMVRGLASLLVCSVVLTGIADCGETEPRDASSDTSSGRPPTDKPSQTPARTPSAMPSDETAESAGAGEAAESAQDQFFKTLQTAVALASSARVTGEQSVGETRTFKGFVAYSDQIELAFTSNVGAGRPLEFRLVDNAVYVRLPGFGRKFFTFDLDDPTLPRGMTAQEFDLSRLLATLQRTTQDVTYVGEERVSDESMDHFRLRLDRAQLLEVLPLDEASPPAPDSATIDLWFDGDGYLRRHDFELGVVGALSLRFDDWGVDVQIDKPTPDQKAGSLFEEG